MRKLLLTMFLIGLVLTMTGAVSSQSFAGVPMTTSLSGAAEAPGPGDPDGSGFAVLWLNPGQSQVCWNITTENLDTAIAAHIHVAPVGVPGPVVVPLSPTSGCTTASRDLIRAIIHNPENYYVNVHTVTYPAGAIRGQLDNIGFGH